MCIFSIVPWASQLLISTKTVIILWQLQIEPKSSFVASEMLADSLLWQFIFKQISVYGLEKNLSEIGTDIKKSLYSL